MALRVLLADESTSIKKVMQLALQDFGVEVKAVPIGVDVIPVAKSWKPDIIFADVLLQKKSGYDLCADIKADSELTSTPVVLMWSSFMEIDAAKVTLCRSERQLEKPFDADTLRSIVKDLVPKLSSNEISNFLSYPNLPDFVEKAPAPPPNFQTSSNDVEPTMIVSAPMTSTTNSAPVDLEEPEDFTQVPLPKVNHHTQTPPPSSHSSSPSSQSSEQWSSGSLDKFRIQIPKDDYVEMDSSLQDLDHANIELAGAGQIQLGDLSDLDETRIRHNPQTSNQNRPRSSTFEPSGANSFTASGANLIDPVHAEQILREQVKIVLQDIAWKILPDMAERIVREELQKLLKDAEKLS